MPGGGVLVTGLLAGGGDRQALGYVVVDPATGAGEPVAAVPLEKGTARAEGFSVLADDGRTLHLYAGAVVADSVLELLEVWDVPTGELLAVRDLFEERRSISAPLAAPDPVGLLPRVDGGVALVTNAWRESPVRGYVPTLLPFDVALEPAGPPVDLAPAGARVTAKAVATGPAGEGLVLLRGSPVSTLLAVPPDGGPPAPVLGVPGFGFTDRLAAGEGWIALPGPRGARRIDLATGRTTVLDAGCPTVTSVTALAAAAGDAVLAGSCPAVRPPEPVLWREG
jgi:hypothetical protein